MIHYKWDNNKNRLLEKTRRISFDRVVLHIEKGDIVDICIHPNHKKYPNQQILVININNYVYAVPFVQNGHERFLETIMPSRKLTKQYLKERNEEK